MLRATILRIKKKTSKRKTIKLQIPGLKPASKKLEVVSPKFFISDHALPPSLV